MMIKSSKMEVTIIIFFMCFFQISRNVRATRVRTEGLAPTRLTSITAPVFLAMKELTVKMVSSWIIIF